MTEVVHVHCAEHQVDALVEGVGAKPAAAHLPLHAHATCKQRHLTCLHTLHFAPEVKFTGRK